MQAYDDGHTVVIVYAGADPKASGMVNRVMALDTITGRELWAADNFDRRFWMRAPVWMPEGSRYMFADEGGGRYTRIDTRTGKPMWSLQLDQGNCVAAGADDPRRVSYVLACLEGEQATLPSFVGCRQRANVAGQGD